MAYIEIASWCDSEVAYNFIRRLKVLEGEARINHNLNEDWWAVQINTHYNGQPFTDASTVTFSQKIFTKTVDEVEDGETLTDSEFELDEQSFREDSFREEYSTYCGEEYYGEPYYGYNEEFSDQKMCIEELLDEEMYDNQEYMSATAFSATALYQSSTYDGLQSLYDQALYNKKDSVDKFNDGFNGEFNDELNGEFNDGLNDELMCGQYMCDKYRTYQFLCVQ
jgi:hypothetical protein